MTSHYLLNKTFLIDTDENMEYDDSILNIVYVGNRDFTIHLRIDSFKKLHLDQWMSGEESGEILYKLKMIINKLIKLKHINLSTEFLLDAEDLNHEDGLDRLVRYYKRLGFVEDEENKYDDVEMLAMKSTIGTFINT